MTLAYISDGSAFLFCILSLIAGFAIARALGDHDEPAPDDEPERGRHKWGEISRAATRAYAGAHGAITAEAADAAIGARPRRWVVVTTDATPGGAILDEQAFERAAGVSMGRVLEALERP